MIIQILLIILSIFVFYQIIVRVLAKLFLNFPAPAFTGRLLDSGFRRKLQPPDKVMSRSGIKEGMKVLEVGCGSGTFTTFAARAVGEKGKIYAVDIQSEMLKQLKDKLSKPENQDIKNIELINASAYKLPFENNYFDLIYMITVLPEIPDQNKALQEIKRVLKPIGILAVTEFLPDPHYPLKSTVIKKGKKAGFILDKVIGSFLNYTVRFKKEFAAKEKLEIVQSERVASAGEISSNFFERTPPMRIIFLNSWYAKAEKAFFDFISKNSSGTDIFCLSEIYPELFSKLEGLLPDFKGFYEEGIFDPGMNFAYGQAIFARKGIEFKSLGKIESPKDSQSELGFAFALPLQFSTKRTKLYVVNVHGKSRPGDKLDTPARIRQSENIINFLNGKDEPVIIGGDFNLMPFTMSIKMFEKAGYRNLIKDFNIKETRNRLSWEQFPDEEKQHFADYVFVSPEVKVKSFEVPNVEISDHLPLILDFSFDSAQD